uniref:Uncharacterized protein n=1 Tax=viral metagenome TaxID=1070528 RepID=A0A6C0ANE3_9ZZZZ
MDFEPKNTFISLSLTTLESYIEKYPEDAEKWLEFLKEPLPAPLPTPMPIEPIVRDEIDNTLLSLQSAILDKETESPIDNHIDGCLICKKSWLTTNGVPLTTLICGHTFHTVCVFYHQYSADYTRCFVEDCTIDTHRYIRNIFNEKRDKKKKVESLLLQSYKKRSDFKQDIKKLKEYLSDFNKYSRERSLLVKNARRDLIHKHIHSLRYFQGDMNESVKLIQSSEEIFNYNTSIRKFRKHAAHIFRKYHTSFRDLYSSKIINCSWQSRYVLERHRQIGYYNLGCRIYPGRKLISDPLEEEQDAEQDLEQELEQDAEAQG